MIDSLSKYAHICLFGQGSNQAFKPGSRDSEQPLVNQNFTLGEFARKASISWEHCKLWQIIWKKKKSKEEECSIQMVITRSVGVSKVSCGSGCSSEQWNKHWHKRI